MSKNPKRPAHREAQPPKWQIVENVVAALERVIGINSEWTISQNVMVPQLRGDAKRQVDVVVECPSGKRQFRVGIDVKNEKRPLSVECVEQLCRKREKLNLDRYIIVSTAGFTKEAMEEADTCRVELKTIEQLESSEIICIKQITTPIAMVDRVDIVFDPGSEFPLAEEMQKAVIHVAGEYKSVRDLGCVVAGNYLSKNQHLPEGQPVILEVANHDATWSNLQIGGKDYGPPDELHIYFTPHYETAPAYLFRSSAGEEMIAAIVPTFEGPKQLTMVLIPEPDGGYRPTVSMGDVCPPRRKM